VQRRQLQESGDGNMNNPLAMEIEGMLNEMGRSMYTPKTGAGPITPQQMMNKNVQQSQGVPPEQQQPPQPVVPQSNQPAVAITPESGYGEGGMERKTVPPELANANFHMSSLEESLITDKHKFFNAVKYKHATTKTAGGMDFMTVGTGKSAQEAFNNATSDARHEHGHGGYTGTIAEKPGFVLITPPKGVDPKQYAEWVQGYETSVPAEYQAQLERDRQRIEDKWGPAGAVQIGANKWLFFGIASS